MHVDDMQKVTNDNDNEPDTMIPIGFAALELLNRVRAKMDLLALLEGEEILDQIKDSGPSATEGRKSRDQQPRKIHHGDSELLPRKQAKPL